ncbi:hypothetical protein M4J06_006966 [Streptomyces coelicoflavus]|uniref:hypothetical protein n=1 Tax=Streptomyces coelicoflavus TaxID=285562 RepID=UPI00210CAA35|nr:hypothetical protein [Streptomyces coelicoflavus]MCQ4202536.1 hypothetical protein [Streptomyces coelicoflavus]
MSSVPPPDRSDDEPAPSVSDEELESFLREAAEGGGAPAPKEPSARARMVAARLREQEEPTPWRGPRPAPKPRRRWGAVVGVVALAAVAVLALRPSLVTDRFPGGEAGAAAAAPAPLPAETARPSGAPGDTGGSEQATRDAPFRGSPALRWAEGADAIELPEAKAVAGMGRADAELALRRTKEFLVAANLDPDVIAGGRPDEALDLLDPEAQKDLLPDQRRGLHEPSREHDPVGLFSRFDPDEVRLAGDVVKVRGRMSLAGGKPGEIKVHADYTFVYPLVRADGGDHVERTIVRREITTLLLDPDRWYAMPGKLAIHEYKVNTFNTACAVYDGYLHPVFPEDRERATGPSVDPYDRSGELRDTQGEECGTVTRT